MSSAESNDQRSSVVDSQLGERLGTILATERIVVVDVSRDLDAALGVIADLRSSKPNTIIVVTSEELGGEVVAALEEGADICIPSGVRQSVIVAQLRALLRRLPEPEPAHIWIGELKVDFRRHEAEIAGVSARLSENEFRLLAALTRNPGAAVSLAELGRAMLGRDPEAATADRLKVLVSRLRHKLQMAGLRGYAIHVKRGYGYSLEEVALEGQA